MSNDLRSKFLAYCPFRSFAAGQAGSRAHRLVDARGRLISDSALWWLGNSAWELFVKASGSEPSTMQLQTFLAQTNIACDAVISALAQRPVRVGFPDGSVARIGDLAGDEWSLGTKISVLYDLQEAAVNADILAWDTIFPALAVKAVDDVIIAESLDNRGLASAIIEAMQYVELTQRRARDRDLEQRLLSAMQSRAARARHKETDEFKTRVIAEWDTGRFRTVAEAARWAQRNFPIKTEVTIRRWISSHRKQCKPE